MINPYSCYAASFILSLIAYGLGWSQLYPPLSASLVGFLTLTIAIHIGFAFYWKSKIKLRFTQTEPFFNPVLTTIFIYLLWTADFVYEGGIPLFKILFNRPYDYRQFGVPSLHVFTVTFASFFTVYLFSIFVALRNRKYLVLCLINLLAALLIYSRAMLMFNIASCLFVYLLLSPALSWKRISVLAVGAITLFFFFGVLGTMRVSFEFKEKYNSDLFLSTGQASPFFRESLIPGEFFWGYIYLSSPVANLQENINTFSPAPVSGNIIVQHIYNEMSFDFISKRINKRLGVERIKENTLPNTPFNVSTVYSRSYSYQGWMGMMMMAIFVLLLPLTYIKMLPANQYSVTAIATLCTMYLFLSYDNTIRFTGLGLQLVYPFLLPLAERTSFWFQKKIAL